ncbi:MAG: substrate-binding domain-containing protein [Acidobacteria bacterium]|nr:substrate-binding domain-containing protein [Acidobacteriota bacterium]
MAGCAPAVVTTFDPPWNPLPRANDFTVAGIDTVPDLHGDVNDPQLVVFFAGNQFMVVRDLVEAFRQAHPEIQRVFVETLPPGVLARQIEAGEITIGNMTITHKPDVYAAGQARMHSMDALFSRTMTYARNRLALMVHAGNPKRVTGLTDLGRRSLRVAMPNPAWEGVGQRIEEAYRKAGGEALRARVMVAKTENGTTFLTRIHHRQTPMRILARQSDVGPVWHTEVAFQKAIGHPIDGVAIPDAQNVFATYVIGQMRAAPRPDAAAKFYDFMSSQAARDIYARYEFLPAEPPPHSH